MNLIRYTRLGTCILLLLVLTACTTPAQKGTEAPPEKGMAEYTRISAEEALAMMENRDVVILDVRTESEFNSGFIPGALLLPVDNIQNQAEALLPDKDMPILVYCRSGNRSRTASHYLLQMGYTSVYDFGGILDWPYETEP